MNAQAEREPERSPPSISPWADRDPRITAWSEQLLACVRTHGVDRVWVYTHQADGTHELLLHGLWRLRRQDNQAKLTVDAFNVATEQWVPLPEWESYSQEALRHGPASPPRALPSLPLLRPWGGAPPNNPAAAAASILSACALSEVVRRFPPPWAKSQENKQGLHLAQMEVEAWLADQLLPRLPTGITKRLEGASGRVFRGLRKVLWQHFIVDREALRWAARIHWPQGIGLRAYHQVVAQRKVVGPVARSHGGAGLAELVTVPEVQWPDLAASLLHPDAALQWWLNLPVGVRQQLQRWPNARALCYLSHVQSPWPVLPARVAEAALNSAYEALSAREGSFNVAQYLNQWLTRVAAVLPLWRAHYGTALWSQGWFSGPFIEALREASHWYGTQADPHAPWPIDHPWRALHEANELANEGLWAMRASAPASVSRPRL